MWRGGRGQREREGKSREDSSGVITEEREDVEGDRSQRVQDAARKQSVRVQHRTTGKRTTHCRVESADASPFSSTTPDEAPVMVKYF